MRRRVEVRGVLAELEALVGRALPELLRRREPTVGEPVRGASRAART